ncbi:membrane protein [Xylella fastidiosa]|nr:chaperone [Xylella fastidiosa 9a5c]ALQ94798.1 membrane protein [Xylella fastidiosa]ARO68906.1 outer-membrane lipoprotein carrier protein [Xylella fastidiosa subsp. pauca]ETE31178.1 membrane protein [Xylella fastidiosa 32]OCA58056.1 membrane protein [Xylella fastidiosa subsp. pauca 11399]
MIWMMPMFSRFRYIVFTVALLSGPVCAGPRADLSAFTRGLKTLQGHFSQEIIDTQGRVKERSNGTVALSLPNLLRWECDAPYKQLVVADGKRVWLFDPDLNQASVRLQGNEERNSPLIALIDPIQLDLKYDVSEEVAMRDGLRWLSLRPRVGIEASFQSASFGFAQTQLARMELVDNLGQRTVIVFSGWQRNPVFAVDTFRFTPGKNVDVIGDR